MSDYNKLHLIHLVNVLPSDAVAITHVKGISGSIRKGLYYSPKRHMIYSKLICPDDGFKYIVEDGRTTRIGINKEILTSYLYASCEKKFKNR